MMVSGKGMVVVEAGRSGWSPGSFFESAADRIS